MPPARIYLDNAATSWPKPEAVYAAIDHYQRHLGAPAGRSGYAEAIEVNQAIEVARRRAATLLSVRDPKQVIFTAGGTDSLNLAIHGLLRAEDHVVTTVIEHNSVLRPLRAAEDAGQVTVTRVECDREGLVDPLAVRAALRPNTRLVAISHASNVTGAIQPVAQVGQVAQAAGALLLVDAAQTAGDLPLAVDDLNADLLATSGHKGLLGPLGVGLLYIKPGVEKQLVSLRQGGTGTQSEADRQPEALPHKYEAGSMNVPGILGLSAGIGFLLERGLDRVREHSRQLTEQLLSGLAAIRGVRLYGPRNATQRVGLVSFSIEGYDPQEIAAMLDAAHRVQVRSGLHCAPLMHGALGTLAHGGTVRLSVGVFTTPDEIATAIAAIGEISDAAI